MNEKLSRQIVFDTLSSTYDILKQKLEASNSADSISTNQVVQLLKLSSEPQTQVSVSVPVSGWKQIPSSDLYFGPKYPAQIYEGPRNHYDSLATITWTGLKNSTYNNQPISKIVAKLKNAQPLSNYPNIKTMEIAVAKDPANFIWYGNMNSIVSDIYFYDKDGNQITFEPHTAYVTLGSLNAYYDFKGHNTTFTRVEGYKPINGVGKSLYDSAITDNGGSFYSKTSIDGTIFSQSGYKVTNQGGYGNNWDHELNTAYACYGAGLIELTGDHLSFQAFTNRSGQSDQAVGDGVPSDNTWITLSTIIPKTPDKVLHYHYNKTIK